MLGGLAVGAVLMLLGLFATARTIGLAGELQSARADLLSALTIAQREGIGVTLSEADEIAERLSDADEALSRAENQIDDPIFAVLGALPIAGTQIDATDAIVAAARSITSRTPTIVKLLEDFISARDSGTGAERLAGLARYVGTHQDQIEEVMGALLAADEAVVGISSDGLIGPVGSAHATLVERFEEIGPLLQAADAAVPVLPAILGVGDEKRYFAMALDNAEIRPIGGLIAAYATPRFTDGLFQDYTFHDILDVDRADQAEYVQPPDPLQDHLLGDDTPWQVADAGWWPDFADNAAEARRLFEIETGDADFDGAIAFTPEFVDALLEIVGPVEVPEAGITVHPGETYLVSLEQVEVLNRGEGRKQFLADLASEVLNRLFALPPEQYPAVLAALDEAGKRRQLQVHLDDPTSQALMTDMGWYTPFEFSADSDRLAIMEANVNPVSKLHVLVDMAHQLDVTLLPDGSAQERLVTTLTNRYAPELPPELERVRSALSDGFLGSFQRRFLAPDAEILEVTSDHPEVPITDPGYVEDEAGSLSVGNYQLIGPGTVRMTTEYLVPDVVSVSDGQTVGTYRLSFFKQAGRDEDALTIRVSVPDGTEPTTWTEGGTRDGDTVTFSVTTEFDRRIEVSFEAAG